ncbi:MAG TPA: GEVED domain-containing protein, partial [Chitinophagaceae bacterium]|nr:GEVED domain-containing protein [Chitinophagaceae bacterium]
VSGVGGKAYCTSGPTSSAGSRIDNVTLGSFSKTNPGGCTTYTDYTSQIASIQPGQTLPLSVTVNSCDATNNAKIVTVYIDYNNNGVFTDAGEMVAQSGTLSNTNTFSTNITTPITLATGSTSLMRVIVQETSAPGSISPCGSYGAGETQDYLVKVTTPSINLGMLGLASPLSGVCANAQQLVTVSVQNKGSVDRSNVALQAVVKNGATTVATLNAVYPAVIAAGSVVNYTFQTPVATVGGTSYTITSSVSAPGDQNNTDDSHTDVVSIAAKPAAPAGGASICNSSTLLQVTNADPSTHYFWYNSASATTPIATGSSASTSFVAANNTFYVAAGASGSVGPASKNDYPSSTTNGDYQATGGNYLLYTAQVPVVLESVRLFTKYPGTVTIIAADLS